jgi:hypothetical protein
MKRGIWIFFLISGLVFSCKKEKPVLEVQDKETFEALLPEYVRVNIKTFPDESGAKAYFENIRIKSGSFLDGDDYRGWCVESTRSIQRNRDYEAEAFSSYDKKFPAGLLKQPENLDKLNWLINMDYAGRYDNEEEGIYTFRDIQVAIWKLVSSYPSLQPDRIGDNFSELRVNRLLEMANNYGHGYVPGCGDMILLALMIGNAQNIVVAYPLTCR